MVAARQDGDGEGAATLHVRRFGMTAVTARGILDMTAVAAFEAQERAGQQPSLFG
jgi:hypothetical protein